MKKVFILPLCAALVGGLSGCSSISEEDCLLGDWYQIGLSDGQMGKVNKAAEYNKDCAEYQVAVDLKLYNDGRKEGLKSFCTYEGGVALGQSNQRYNNVCPPELSSEFMSGYTPHYNLAKAQSELSLQEGYVTFYADKLADDTLGSSERKNAIKALNAAKNKSESAEYKVRKYENELAVHNIKREKAQITKELASNNISDSRRNELTERLDLLNKQQTIYEGFSQVESTINSIKGIADLL